MSNETLLIEKWMNTMFTAIVNNNFGPTRTARFQYLVSTILCYSFLTYKNINNGILKEPELSFIFTREKSLNAVDNIIFQSMIYLFDQLSINKNILGESVFSLNPESNRVLNNIKLFLDRRNNDNYKNANNPINIDKFPNKTKAIQVFNPNQDLSDLDKTTWTPLQHTMNGPIQQYLTPYWGEILPVEGININKYMDIADDNYSVDNQELNRQLEIAEILKTYENLDDTKRIIAEYFRGGKVAPPGIWNVMALYTIKSTNMRSIVAVEFLYLLNVSMFMSSIVAWAVKLKYMQARPIQEIRLLNSQDVTTFDGSKVNNKAWKTLQPQNSQTPPFPDYISGHSTFSSAAATIFEKYFPNYDLINFVPFTNYHGDLISSLLSNNNYINTVKVAMIKNGSSDVIHNDTQLRFPTCAVKLTFNSWRDIANLSGISRIYGGIHGNNANYTGLIIGECIARDVLERN